ncbi:MAG: TPM domain-containing protein [Bacteroidales bacterium]|nr:TPM domain-containing protein [Bacteroidales bacterium]MCM1416014.1 TPM domain-containing protein [bacterium]MCM1423820.1 TPM domain-containing protein [bacterium]
MKEYFRYFKWLYIVLAAVFCLFLLFHAGHWGIAKSLDYQRTNTECTVTERVFDGADVLTDKEEKKLRKLIAKREKQTGCDIVLITLNEPLEEFAKAYEPGAYSSEYVRVYAEQFWEQNGMGYDKPDGDGVVLVDNYSREDDGYIHTWFCTTGRAYDAYYTEDIDHLLDNVYRYVEKDPYRAYRAYVNTFYHDMLGWRMFHFTVPGFLSWAIGLIAAVIFTVCNWRSKKGKKTTTATTYVAGGQPVFRVQTDRFLRKTVTQRKIETSSSSGGGGGRSHGGGGGGHHGGGGHSR